jgi:hypothetical protein
MARPSKATVLSCFPELNEWDAQVLAEYMREAEGHRDAVDKVFGLLEDSLEDAGESAYFGVEAIRSETQWDNYYGDTVALYLNTGDTYACTLLYDTVKGKFHLTTMGDFVEGAPKYYGIY